MHNERNHGYYTVFVETGEDRIAYHVKAQSDYHAARLVRAATGLLPYPQDIEGPHPRPFFPRPFFG